MIEILSSRAMQRLVALIGFFWVLTKLSEPWNDLRVWAISVLLIVLEYLSMEEGKLLGAEKLLAMPRDTLIQVKDLIDASPDGMDDEDLKKLDDIFKNGENDD